MTGTTSAIRSIVANHIRGYERQAEPAIVALENAMFTAAENLLSQARTLGATEDQARAAITTAGLSFRPAPQPVTAAASNGGGKTKSRLRALEQSVSELQALARRHLGA